MSMKADCLDGSEPSASSARQSGLDNWLRCSLPCSLHPNESGFTSRYTHVPQNPNTKRRLLLRSIGSSSGNAPPQTFTPNQLK